MKFRVKEAFSGKVRLERGDESVVLDENTPQPTLARLHDSSELAKHYIELVPAAPAAVVAETK